LGHSATHEPAEPEEEGIRYEVSVQLVQLPAVRSHERHDVAHAAHASEPSSWYSPVGQADTQLPAEKEMPGKHDKHDALPPPLHVLHDPSHASQKPLSSYLPAGHEATHSLASKYGVPEVGHVRHAVEAEPEQVRQEGAHAAHKAASFSSTWT
jgi:hypothetical protein